MQKNQLTQLANSTRRLYKMLQNFWHTRYLCNKHYEDFDELNFDFTAFFESQPVSFDKRRIELLPARWAKAVENNGDHIVD
jgi:hypothetical protein